VRSAPEAVRARFVLARNVAVLVLVGAVYETFRRGGGLSTDTRLLLSTVSGTDVVQALAVLLVAERVAAAGFGVAISQAARLGGPVVIRAARVATGATALGACVAVACWGPTNAGTIAAMTAVVVGVTALRMSDPRPGPSSAGWWPWLMKGGALARRDQWLAVVLRHAMATGDPALALAFVERARPCLPPALARSWPEYVGALALCAAGRYADAAERLARARRELPADDVLMRAIQHVHVDALLSHALSTGTTPPEPVLDDCARVLAGLTPDDADPAARQHTEAMLRLFRGDPTGAANLCRQVRTAITDRRARAIVDATVAVALARAGDLEGAREHARRVPPSCPLHEAACRATLTAGLPAPTGG
jgi:hypothetical protein